MQVKKEFKTMRKGGTIKIGRRLEAEEIPVSEIVEIDVLPGYYSEPENLDFDWYVDDFTEKEMRIQLEFT